MNEQFYLRRMIRRDLKAVLDIEREAFRWPWSPGDFVDALRWKWTIGWVAEAALEVIAGYVIYTLSPTAIEILNLGVGPDWRRRGLGTKFVDKLKSKLTPDRRREILTNVWEDNLPAQVFFRAKGFRAVRIGEVCDEEGPGEYRYLEFVHSPLATPQRVAKDLGCAGK